jgi:ribonucleoside-diphosphate reductase alpha chain
VHDGVRFLDDVIDVNRYPLPQIEHITRANRKIGLGVMGLADLFIRVAVPYDSPRALELGGQIAAFIEKESLVASIELAKTRGAFANHALSRWAEKGVGPLRNATTTTVAPTGTISIIAGCSSGIEPLFAVSYTRHVLDGEQLVEVHPAFLAAARARGFWSEEVARLVASRGRVRGLDVVPQDLQALYPTAHDLAPETHVRMQAAFQKHAHAAVSKTVNFPEDAPPEDVLKVYRMAYDLGCKGVTVYRDRSKLTQVLSIGDPAAAADEALPPSTTVCPECGSLVVGDRGCTACRECGWSICG